MPCGRTWLTAPLIEERKQPRVASNDLDERAYRALAVYPEDTLIPTAAVAPAG